jgi:hypothetical protein
MYVEATDEGGCGCTWRPRSSKLRDAFGGHDCYTVEEILKVVDQEVIDLNGVNLEAVNLKVVDQEACEIDHETLFTGYLVCVGM